MIPQEVADIADILEEEFEGTREEAIATAWRIYNKLQENQPA